MTLSWSGQKVLGIKTAKGRSQDQGWAKRLVLPLSLITCVTLHKHFTSFISEITVWGEVFSSVSSRSGGWVGVGLDPFIKNCKKAGKKR